MFKILKHIEKKKDIICFRITNRLIGWYIKNRIHVPVKQKFKYLYSMWKHVMRFPIFRDRDVDDVMNELDDLCKNLNIKNNIRELYDLTFIFSLYEIHNFLYDNGIEA